MSMSRLQTKYQCGCSQISCETCSLCRGKPVLPPNAAKATKSACVCAVCRCACTRVRVWLSSLYLIIAQKGTVGKEASAIGNAIAAAQKKVVKGSETLLKAISDAGILAVFWLLLFSDNPQQASLMLQLGLAALTSSQLRALQAPLRAILPTDTPANPVPLLMAPASSASLSLSSISGTAVLSSSSTSASPAMLLVWLRTQENAKTLTSEQVTKLEHVAANSKHPNHEELLLHWTAFGQNTEAMLKSARRIVTVL